jgi:predicted transcriptional regulator YdeE
MKSIFKDVPNILKRYMSLKEKYGIPNQKLPWEYVSLSKNFKDDKTWEYFTGHVVDKVETVPEEFSPFKIPTGKYAIFSIKPKFKFMLGFHIIKMKKYIYGSWLPNSAFDFAGYEFEYNNQEMFKENQHYINLYIAIKDKKSN